MPAARHRCERRTNRADADADTVVALVEAVLGGLAGMRFDRRLDEVGLGA
ncbi:hypothetical protein OG218_03700 [Kineococcus sp. NBC_00420]